MGTISGPHIREETEKRWSTMRGEKLRGKNMNVIRLVKPRSPSPDYHHNNHPPLEHRRPLFSDSHNQKKMYAQLQQSARLHITRRHSRIRVSQSGEHILHELPPAHLSSLVSSLLSSRSRSSSQFPPNQSIAEKKTIRRRHRTPQCPPKPQHKKTVSNRRKHTPTMYYLSPLLPCLHSPTASLQPAALPCATSRDCLHAAISLTLSHPS